MTLSLKSACVGIASALVATSAMAQAAPPAPPSNQVAIGGTASAGCWATGAGWTSNITPGFTGTIVRGANFTGASSVTFGDATLVGANRRASPTPGGNGGMRLRFALNCNAVTQAQLRADNGRFLNTNQPQLPLNMPQQQTANRSGTFGNAYGYTVEFGFVNDPTLNGQPSPAQMVNGAGGGYNNSITSAPLNSAAAPVTLATVNSASDWANIRRLDLRFQLISPPDVNGASGGTKPVMIAGAYSETFTITVAPGL